MIESLQALEAIASDEQQEIKQQGKSQKVEQAKIGATGGEGI